MKIRNLIEEDIVNYKKTSMFIATCFCDYKCCRQLNEDICMCQNSPTANSKIIEINDQKLVNRYIENDLTHSIVFGGLQPFKQFEEMYLLIKEFRKKTKDDIIIYTGYYKQQIQEQLKRLMEFQNIIIKFGRFVPGQKKHYDDVLGVELANEQQYAEKIS